LVLIPQDAERQSGIEFRVIAAAVPELPILVVLDQVVVWVPRECERVQPKRIHLRETQQPQVWIGCGEDLRVEFNQVVTDQKRGTVGQLVELGEAGTEIAASVVERLARVTSHGRESMDSTVVPTDFEVDR
jgi:uncharacterized protein